jgi:hypothetical protein
VSYQASLRAIGAWLDDAWATGATVIETPDGWAVRYGFERYSPPALLKQFSDATVKDLHAIGQRRRGSGPSTRSSAGRHEDLFRTVGFELDTAGATNVLIDHIGPDLLVTFEVQNPAQGFSWRKEMLVVGSDHGRGLLRHARQRRAPESDHTWFSWLRTPAGRQM